MRGASNYLILPEGKEDLSFLVIESFAFCISLNPFDSFLIFLVLLETFRIFWIFWNLLDSFE